MRRVAVVGAGNGDDVPLARLAARAGDAGPDRPRRRGAGARRGADRREGARGRGGRHRRSRRRDHRRGARGSRARRADAAGHGPLGAYDVVVADLVLTQLLYPALKSAGTLSGREIDEVLLREGQPLTDAVVARLHASAPVVVILHDLLGWWKGHQQPFALDTLLRRPAAEARKLARAGSTPYGCDPWVATRNVGARVVDERHWRWPFAAGADYLVFGLVTARRDRDPAARPPTAAPPGRPPQAPRPR